MLYNAGNNSVLYKEEHKVNHQFNANESEPIGGVRTKAGELVHWFKDDKLTLFIHGFLQDNKVAELVLTVTKDNEFVLHTAAKNVFQDGEVDHSL